jgi:PAS domain S-box-containing protein
MSWRWRIATYGFRLPDFRLRTRLAALLVAASLLPLALTAYVDYRYSREALFEGTQGLLRAGAERIARELDEFHRGRLQSAGRIAAFPETTAYCRASIEQRAALQAGVTGLLATFPSGDATISGAALLDGRGRVLAATNPAVIGIDLSFRPYVQAALQGRANVSDVYLTVAQAGESPAIAYAAPMRGQDARVACVALLLVNAQAIWQRIRAADGLAGTGSFAVLFDKEGIRIAHSHSQDIVFHPGGALDAAVIDRLVAEQRFGKRTRALLQDVRAFPEQFERARAAVPRTGVFLGFAPVNQTMNYGIARRFETVPWTLFYMLPEATVQARIASQTRSQVVLALAIIAGAAVLGLLFARSIARPVSALGAATTAIAGGDLAARVPQAGDGELGRLAASFNAMAERIQAQSAALERSRDELEQRVHERTAELASTAERLRAEMAERMRAEAAIRESQELLQSIIDNTSAVIYVKDLQGRYTMINRRYRELFHVADDDVVGRCDADLFPPDAAAAVRALDLRVIDAASPVVAEETVPLDDGTHTYLSVKCPLRDGEGRVHGVFGISTDITDRKHAEVRLQAQLERLRLLDQITSAIAERQDLQSIYQVAVRSVEERLPVDFCCVCRYNANDACLTVIRVGVHSAALAMDLAMPDGATVPIDENGLSRCVRGHLVYEADLEPVPFAFPRRLLRGGLRSLVAAPLQSESQVFGVLVAARRRPGAFDSGECEFLRQLSAHVALAARQAELHASLQRAYDDLRQTQQSVMQQERLRALGEMASGIAHDINNAISPISLYAENLLERETGLTERGRAQLQTIAMASDDVAATVARMREFYRQREPQAALRPVHLNELVRNVVELTRVRWQDMPQQRGAVVTMEVDLAAGLPAVLGIETELREALINIVFNAVDAMPAGGTLSLRTRCPEAEGQPVRLEVSDTGVGMDEPTRRRCLEPFFTTKGERGTGLGLAMVYGVVQRHGADIEIESAVDHGTTVRIMLPAAGDAGRVPAAAASPALRPEAPLRLLLVDDDPVMLRTLSETLSQDGHMVTTASGGQAGIDAVHQAHAAGGSFDAVITDLGMPYVDGRRVAAAVKETDAATPVIMLTGWGQRLAADGDIPQHVDQMLAKPPKVQSLRAALALATRPRRGAGGMPAPEEVA